MMKTLIALVTVLAIPACGGSQPVQHTAGTTPHTDPPTSNESTTSTEPTEPDPAQQRATLASAETAAYEAAKPAFGKYCGGCHTATGEKASKKKLDHFSMDSYPFGGEHTKSIGNEVRVVLAIDGNKKATMPSDKPGSLGAEDLAVIKAWSEAWQASGAAGNHPAEPAEKDDD